MPAKQKIYKWNRADTIDIKEDIQKYQKEFMETFIFGVLVTRILVSPQQPNRYVSSNNSINNDLCIIVLAFIPCRADDIHGQRIGREWPCTLFIRVGFIIEFYVDFP